MGLGADSSFDLGGADDAVSPDPDDWDALLSTPADTGSPPDPPEPAPSETADSAAASPAESRYLLVFGVQRFRSLQRSDDGFGFGGSLDDGKPGSLPPTDRQFRELVEQGPPHGIHLLLWCDRVGSLERVCDRRDLREIDQRVLFQMSANDSAQLIDANDANDLGPHRALLHREDHGTLTKFRPYAAPL